MTAPSQTTEIAAPGATAAQFVPALRTAAAAGLVAFGLCFPIISYHAESNINNELVLIGRWPLSFGIAAIVFVFVFLRQMARADWRIWFDRVGSVAAGGMGGALVQAAREGEGTAPPVGRPGGVRALCRPVHAWPRDLVPADLPLASSGPAAR